jgi:transcriptional regulator with XRE-family HTH domain
MVPKVYEAIGGAIRRRRELIGMTQATLAQKVGLSRPSITNIERGGQALFVHQILDLSRALGVGVTALLPAFEPVEPEPTPGLIDDDMRALLHLLDDTRRRSSAR